jgi:hypothetical protein
MLSTKPAAVQVLAFELYGWMLKAVAEAVKIEKHRGDLTNLFLVASSLAPYKKDN